MNKEKEKKQNKLLIEIGIVIAIALIFIIIMPPLLSGFRLNLFGKYLSLAIVALGIDLIWGYTGLLSLGHGIFFALGGYALAMHLKLQIPPDASSKLPEFMSLYGVTELPGFWQPFYSFPLTLLAIMIIPGLLGGALGYLIFRNRIKGVYFSILTQAATIVFYNLFNGQQKLFNGTNGLQNFTTFLGANINDDKVQVTFYIVTVIFVALAYGLCRWLTTGKFGRLLIAIRDDENRVRFSGYDSTNFKLLVFIISAILAGIAGALYTLQNKSISPRQMDIAFSIEMVIWVAVGGRASLTGAILGALLVNFAKTLLSEKFPEIWLFFQGGLFLIVVMVLPDGFVGWVRDNLDFMLSLVGIRKQVLTYPDIDLNPDVQFEKDVIEHHENSDQ